MLVLGTSRSTDEPTDPVLLADPGADGLLIAPGPLGPASSGALVAAALGAPDEALARACLEATAGNPLLPAALAAEGVAPVAARAGAVRTVGAQTVSRIVLRRLGRVDADGVAVARRSRAAGHLAEALAMAGDAGIRARVGELLVKVLAFTGWTAERLEVGPTSSPGLPVAATCTARSSSDPWRRNARAPVRIRRACCGPPS